MDRRSFLVGAGAIATAGLVSSTAVALSGSGTESDPFEIADWYDLDAVRDNLEAHYVLVDDLDQDTDGYDDIVANNTWDDGSAQGWEPPGTVSDSFEGHFNGDGHTISNLYIDAGDLGWVGLFGSYYPDDSSYRIENLVLKDADITGGGSNIAAIVGEGAGDAYRCAVTGTIDGDFSCGAIYGKTQGASVIECKADALVSGADSTGGLVGGLYFSDDEVVDSYSLCDVEGGTRVGGIVGDVMDNERVVKRSFAAGSVNGTDNVGGVAGGSEFNELDNWQAEHVYWDVEATGQEDGIGEGYEADGVIGLTADQMTGDAAAENMEGFDFV